jgi:hypothetical protein
MNEQLPKEERLSEVELTDEQRKRTLALYRESDGAYHDLFVACANVVVLRDENQRLREQVRALVDIQKVSQ